MKRQCFSHELFKLVTWELNKKLSNIRDVGQLIIFLLIIIIIIIIIIKLDALGREGKVETL